MRLVKELVNRAGGEFMSLGFLAFCVFLFNVTGGFAFLARRLHSGELRFPATESDWLHMVEIVHIKLFVGMIVYFLMISRIISGSVRRIRKWERLRLRRIKHQHVLRTTSQSSLRSTPSSIPDTDLAKYMHWRSYFLARVLSWRTDFPGTFEQICQDLAIDPESPGAQNRLSELVEERFSFGAYLALNVERGVRDSIQVHKLTWFVMLCLFAVFACLCRFARVNMMTSGTPVCIAMAVGILAMMQWLACYKQKRISSFDPDEPGPAMGRTPTDYGRSKGVHRQYSTEIIALRIFQIVLFLLCYVFSRTVLDLNDWGHHFYATLMYCSLFALLFASLAHFLPRQVPLFLALMALPPYVDRCNLMAFCEIIRNGPQVPELLLPGATLLQDPSPLDGGGGAVKRPQIDGAPASESSSFSSSLEGDVSAVRRRLAEIEARLRAVEESARTDKVLEKGLCSPRKGLTEGLTVEGCLAEVSKLERMLV